MKNFFQSITTTQVTFWIAVLGFIMSLWNFIATINANHRRLSMEATCAMYMADRLFVIATFVNKSKLPITITRAVAQVDGSFYEAGSQRLAFVTYSCPEKRGKAAEHSHILPLTIDPLGCRTVLLCTDKIPKTTSAEIPISFYSNRGKVRKALIVTQFTDDAGQMLRRLE